MRAPEARSVPYAARRFWYCFGGLALFSTILLALSGVFMTVYYQPTPDRAYASVYYLSNYVHYGWLVRSVHVWGARLVMVLVLVHMGRVFLAGAYRHPRELNWLAGVMLLVVVIVLAATGSLLPWDTRGLASAAALVEATSRIPLLGDVLARAIAGGSRIGAATLTRFYAAHVFVLPAILTALLVAHFRMVRKHGISESL